MEIFLTHLKDDAEAKNDIINDSTLHGLREIYKKMLSIILCLHMYKDEKLENLLIFQKLWVVSLIMTI